MPAKRGKRKPAPAIVPRFLKDAVTIGVIPAIAACSKPQRVQPVVAYMAAPAPAQEAGVTPNPPVVAAYQPPPAPPPPPVVAAMAIDAQPIAPPIDAGVDAPKKAKQKTEKKSDKQQRPPPPVVAAMLPRDGQ